VKSESSSIGKEGGINCAATPLSSIPFVAVTMVELGIEVRGNCVHLALALEEPEEVEAANFRLFFHNVHLVFKEDERLLLRVGTLFIGLREEPFDGPGLFLVDP
jgi:hypothetical protein